MNEPENIPSDSYYENLARDLGLRLQGKDHELSADDTFIQLLDNYQQDHYQEVLPSGSTDRIWNAVRSKTIQKPSSARIHRLINPRYFAVAASVILIAIVGLLWSVNNAQPELLLATTDSIKIYTADDGSEIILRPHSALYAIQAESGRSYSLTGEAVFDVVHDQDQPFTVRTPHGKVEVLGTEFNLSTWGDKSSVYLFEGTVAIYAVTGDEAILKPGQSVTFSAGTFDEPENDSAGTYTDWINNTIVFSDSGLKEVFDELEHHFNIRIETSENAEAEMVTGTLRLTSLQQTLSDLELVLGGTFSKVGDRSYRFELTN